VDEPKPKIKAPAKTSRSRDKEAQRLRPNGFFSRRLCPAAAGAWRECFFVIFVIACFLPTVGLAQTAANQPPPAAPRRAAPDTVKAAVSKKETPPAKAATPDSTKAREEVELEAIAIEAIIEKPNVNIIPRRLEPELEEVEFVERSFDRELKEVPRDLLLLDDDLDRVARLEGLKKLLEKKKKKQDK